MVERKTVTKRKSGKRATRAAPKKPAARKTVTKKRAAGVTRTSPKKWSQDVTEHSDAMDLADGVFKGRNPHKIALSIKHSAETSHRRKATPFQSAMSMLTFYINRAGHNLTPARRKVLDAAKDHLRELFGKSDPGLR